MLPNKTLEYRLRKAELAAAGAGAGMEVVVPGLKWLLKVNGSSAVSLQSLTLAHTEWELESKVRGSWRDRALLAPPSTSAPAGGETKQVGGSGPLPVETQIMNAWKANRLSIDNCTVRNGGATALYAAHSNGVSITRSVWSDFGAAAIETAVVDDMVLSDCRIKRAGQL